MDETSEKRPRAALINREWYIAARRVLPADQLGRLLQAAVEYVLEDVISDNLNQDERIVFEMARPWLDSDISAYRARCERNSRNARGQSQRVAASGSEWLRVAANTTPTPTPTPTPTLSQEKDPEKEIEREKWLVYGYFWATGSKAVNEECRAFWSYYESLGWKNNKGAQIVNKVAAARMWRRQFETGSAPNGADAWYRAVQGCPVKDYRLWVCYAGAESQDSRAIVRLRLNEPIIADLKEVLPALERELAKAWRVQEVTLQAVG